MNELYIKRIQNRMKKGIESGMLNPEQQYGLIETCIDDLLSVKAINDAAVKQFEKDINDALKQLEELQNRIADIYKKTYENILEL